MQFLVRWEGFNAKHDTWLTWAELKDNPMLHDFLNKRNLSDLIPKSNLEIANS